MSLYFYCVWIYAWRTLLARLAHDDLRAYQTPYGFGHGLPPLAHVFLLQRARVVGCEKTDEVCRHKRTAVVPIGLPRQTLKVVLGPDLT